MVIKKRIEEQLMEEAQKMGASINPGELSLLPLKYHN